MIPALLAAPLVEGVVGSVVNQFSPQPAVPHFNPYLQTAAATAPQSHSPSIAASGTYRTDQWSQFSASDTQTWLKSLQGRHVNATDLSGRVISGTVDATQLAGGANALNIGGHLVSLSQLKQISWSPVAA